MDWQPGQWVECPHTQEKGKILPSKGRSIRISLGEGITLYASPSLLVTLGWRLTQDGERNSGKNGSTPATQ